MFKYFIFDLDGTLTDPSEGITNSVAYALNKFGIEVNDRTSLLKFIGPPLVDAFSEFYGFSRENSEKATAFYRETFSIKGIYENKVYPEVKDMLEALKSNGKVILLATSKPEVFAREILRYFDLAKYFDFIAGATFDSSRNSKDKVIEYALKEGDIVDLENAVMIGDRYHDIEGAKKNGLKSIGALYGFGSREELVAYKADYLINSPKELLKYM